MKILIIDDNEADQYYDEIILKEQLDHVDITAAMEAEEALALLNSDYVPDVILLDINMPKVDGYEFLEHYTEENTKAVSPVIMLTTSAHGQDKAVAERFDCVKGYFVKPISEESVRELCELVKPSNGDKAA